MPSLNGAQLLVRALAAEGVELLFGYPGGAIMPVYDALYGSPIRHILTRHEQGAALAAEGYARATGKVGVCLATSGPGATNLVTGIADAYLDSVPLVCITGQVGTALLGTDAFQEVDIFGITLPIVKHSFLVRDVRELPRILREAFVLARTGRPGPVLIDLPKDVAQSDATGLAPLSRAEAEEASPAVPTAEALAAALALLRASERPLLYIGGGVVAARAVPALRAFEHATGLPAVCTLKALGALPAAHPLFLGMLGMHGSRAANLSVQASDLLVCVGARFDDRATGKLGGFAPHARVLHLDIDPAEVGKLRAADVTVLGDLRLSLAALSTTLEVQPWRDACMARRRADGPLAPPGGDAPIDAPDMFRQLSAHLDDRTFVTTDVGQHQMWAAQHVAVPSPELFITSGGLGTMGFGLPAAVGAQLGRPDARVVNITGDGSIMMNVQELGTIKRYALPVKILLCDNQTLGMVRQWQDLFFEQRYSETCLTDNPDFLTLARAFDIPGERISRADEVPGALARMLAAAGPYLLHVVLPRGNVWPLVPPGKDNGSMLEGA